MLRVAILMLSILSGGAAAWLSLTRPVVSPPDMAEAPQMQLEQILVATADIVPGTKIDPTLLRWQPWPRDAVGSTHLTLGARPDAMADLTGMTVQGLILVGEPVHEGKLVSGQAGILSVMLSAGSRAVAVRISAENTAGGFILPNDRVDVLHTVAQQTVGGANTVRSSAILRNVRVLAIDQMIDNANGSIVGKTATLELSPSKAEIVTAAQASGEVTLALRALEDADAPEEQMPVAAPEEERLVVAAQAEAIRLIRGGREELIRLEGE